MMMDEKTLLADIGGAFSLARQRGWNLSVSFLDRRFHVLYPELSVWEIHPCPLCDLVKSAPASAGLCYRNKVRLRTAAVGAPRYVACPFGVEEFLYPVYWEKTPVAYLHLCGFRGKSEQTERVRKLWERRLGSAYRAAYENLDTCPPAVTDACAFLAPVGYMMALLYENFVKESTPVSGYEKLHADMLRYICENYATDFTVEDMALHMHYSPSHLRYVFRRESGVPFASYLTDFRLTQAARLLREGGVPVSVVATRVGFHDPERFCVLFRRKWGMPPSVWRKTKRKS